MENIKKLRQSALKGNIVSKKLLSIINRVEEDYSLDAK
jgi:hypothetical protein